MRSNELFGEIDENLFFLMMKNDCFNAMRDVRNFFIGKSDYCQIFEDESSEKECL